ncbi:MAG: DUF1036 domain-containing protein [Alphaproteobacteria bacterium]|nr:DUF1036 domain-containing protein [Alphaproteobacteria bacterium]
MARERLFVRNLVLRLLPVLVLALWITPAQAEPNGWQLCNQTSFILEAATGRPEGRGVIVEGWTRLRPGECKVAMPAPLKPGVDFVFARSSSAHRGGQRVWNGNVPLCVDANGSFSVESPTSCSAMGLTKRGFQAVKIDKRTSWTTIFHETDYYNKPGQSAQAAGVQRLLEDAGADSDLIDGFMSRKTRAAIATFLAEHKLPANMSDVDLIDVLEDVARNRSLEVGMMLCNRTDNRIWAAIARRRPDGWESRGWWSLDASACVRTVDESLIATPHYVYAEMDSTKGPRHLIGANTSFCTARSKFAIIGREDCDQRKYQQADFAETPIPEDGKLVYEFFDRNFGPPERKGP